MAFKPQRLEGPPGHEHAGYRALEDLSACAVHLRRDTWSYVEIIVAPDTPALDRREQACAYVFTPGEGGGPGLCERGRVTRCGRGVRRSSITSKRWVGAVSTGATVTDAARHAGVPVDTVKHWLKRGRRESGTGTEYAELSSRCRRDLLRLLGVKAREGNVSAIRLLLVELRRDEAARPPVPYVIAWTARALASGAASDPWGQRARLGPAQG
jgi:hypothetical protein